MLAGLRCGAAPNDFATLEGVEALLAMPPMADYQILARLAMQVSHIV